MKKYIIFILTVILSGCCKGYVPSTFVIRKINISYTDNGMAIYDVNINNKTDRMGSTYFSFVDSIGKYEVGDTLIIKSRKFNHHGN